MDLFFTNGATIPGLRKSGPSFSNRLYHNNCDGTFTDVTARAGVGGEGYSMAVATAISITTGGATFSSRA